MKIILQFFALVVAYALVVNLVNYFLMVWIEQNWTPYQWSAAAKFIDLVVLGIWNVFFVWCYMGTQADK